MKTKSAAERLLNLMLETERKAERKAEASRATKAETVVDLDGHDLDSARCARCKATREATQ